jgi:hypothetical protein
MRHIHNRGFSYHSSSVFRCHGAYRWHILAKASSSFRESIATIITSTALNMAHGKTRNGLGYTTGSKAGNIRGEGTQDHRKIFCRER